jgi:HEAT repeat protein
MLRWFTRLFRKSTPPPHPLLVQSQNDDPVTRALAAAELGRLTETWASVELVRMLTDLYKPVRDSSLAALRQQGAVALPTLIESLKHPRPEVQLIAAELLGELRLVECVQPLLVVLKYADRPLQRVARRALQQCGTVAIPSLRAALEEPQPWVREQVADLLATAEAKLTEPQPASVTQPVVESKPETSQG